eukprot:4661398-Pleurochrysis_carterae.AAC.1
MLCAALRCAPQLDNASDNKSRWMLGFFAWLVKLGWVKKVRLSMIDGGAYARRHRHSLDA